MRRNLPILATLLVFGWLVADKTLLRPSPAIADDYHEQARSAIDGLPRHFGQWAGQDVPVPAGAVKLLRPNTILSREYRNLHTGESVTFLIVQVRDARDILGHYPPVCYPGQGWKPEGVRAVDWDAAWDDSGRPVLGTQYAFGQDSLAGSRRVVVDNFLVLPDGTTCRDMDAVEAAAQDRLRKMFGAAQVQLLYDASIPPERRAAVTREFIEFSRPALSAVGAGANYVAK